jgi:hypothetical protein
MRQGISRNTERAYTGIESRNSKHQLVARLTEQMLPLFGATRQGRFCQTSGKIWQPINRLFLPSLDERFGVFNSLINEVG